VAWITPADITDVYPSDGSTEGLIDHVQALAEIEIGTQDTPTGQLQAVMVQITHRFYLASTGDENIVQETLGPHSYTRAQISGLGLTKAEKALLKKAVGETQFWVQPLSRGDRLETAGIGGRHDEPGGFIDDATGGDPIPWFHADDLEQT